MMFDFLKKLLGGSAAPAARPAPVAASVIPAMSVASADNEGVDQSLSPEEIAEIEADILTVEPNAPDDEEDGESEDEGEDWSKKYQFSVWLDEAAEAIIGTRKFGMIADRWRALEGVEEVVHEDREVFYIRANGYTCESLAEALKKEWFRLRAG